MLGQDPNHITSDVLHDVLNAGHLLQRQASGPPGSGVDQAAIDEDSGLSALESNRGVGPIQGEYSLYFVLANPQNSVAQG
jgi:hypothetical protein